jgi:hypothetical protein
VRSAYSQGARDRQIWAASKSLSQQIGNSRQQPLTCQHGWCSLALKADIVFGGPADEADRWFASKHCKEAALEAVFYRPLDIGFGCAWIEHRHCECWPAGEPGMRR